jgi:hypothetical protein
LLHPVAHRTTLRAVMTMGRARTRGRSSLGGRRRRRRPRMGAAPRPSAARRAPLGGARRACASRAGRGPARGPGPGAGCGGLHRVGGLGIRRGDDGRVAPASPPANVRPCGAARRPVRGPRPKRSPTTASSSSPSAACS